MALYAGEAVRIRAQVTDPDTQAPFVLDEDGSISATLELWSPGKNPAKDPEIRDAPDHGPAPMGEFRPEQSDFVVFVHTRGAGIEADPTGAKWEPGKWSFRVRITGNAFVNWEYGSFTIRP